MSEKPVVSIKTLARYEPAAVYIGTGEYVAECVRADDGDYYLAADVDAEIKALRAEIERLREQLRLAAVDQAIAEAERDRLATTLQAEVEALRAEVDGTIRELLEERNADLKRLAFLSNEPVIEGFVGIPKDVYDYASDCAEECGRDEPNDEDMLNGMRRLIDAAIAAANGGRDE